MQEVALGVLRSVVVFVVFLSVTMLQAAEPQTVGRPVANMPETVFEATDTVDGENIKHDFVIQNRGTGVLHVRKGRSACGYTVDSLPGPIPPGEEGVVTVLFSTCGGGGKNLKKTLTVATNDPDNARISLTVKAKIIKPYTLQAERVKLKGNLGETIKKTLKLSPTDDNPFTVQEVTAKRGRNIRFDLEEIWKRNRVRYKLTVENTAKTPGIYFDTLYIKTDSNIKPIISITVIGKIGE
jgi:hypothetical protein